MSQASSKVLTNSGSGRPSATNTSSALPFAATCVTVYWNGKADRYAGIAPAPASSASFACACPHACFAASCCEGRARMRRSLSEGGGRAEWIETGPLTACRGNRWAGSAESVTQSTVTRLAARGKASAGAGVRWITVTSCNFLESDA